MGGLTLDFRPTLLVVTHDQGRLGKIDHFGGMFCCFGGLMGPADVPDGRYGVPGEGWGWGGGLCGLTLDFRPMLPVVIHNRGFIGKMIVLGVCIVWGV